MNLTGVAGIALASVVRSTALSVANESCRTRSALGTVLGIHATNTYTSAIKLNPSRSESCFN